LNSLALAGKLAVTEDALTASLLDALRYSASAPLLQQLLIAGATPLVPGAVLPPFDRFDVEPWPQLRGREPDARLLLARNGAVVCRLLLEAKLGAAKSGGGAIDEDALSGDQLASYLHAESVHHRGEPVALLYLTHHAAMPREDLVGSAEQLGRAGRADLVPALFWTSWRDVEQRLRSLSHRPPWLEDLLALLGRARMRRFDGFDLRTPALVAAQGATFYEGKPRAGYPDPRTTPALGALSGGWSYQRCYFAAAELHALLAPNFYRRRS
jgi:hypothetical protein